MPIKKATHMVYCWNTKVEEDTWKPENVHLVRTCCRVIYLKENYMKGEGERTKEETLSYFLLSPVLTHTRTSGTNWFAFGRFPSPLANSLP